MTLDGTPLSECLSDTTDGGELQEVGAAYVDAASTLADRAAADPEGDAALQLGYLLGAVKRSEAGAQGVGYELGRRLQAEAARVPDGSAAFARGRRAGTKADNLRCMAVQQELWGSETSKAVENFPVSGQPVPVAVIRMLGRDQGRRRAHQRRAGAARRRPRPSGSPPRATRSPPASTTTSSRSTSSRPGSGTSSNMNANEVLANLAGEGAHPNDHVNMGQSSNDVFPSAVHLAAVSEARDKLLPALEQLAGSLGAKADEFADVVKAGRTHMMDAVPVTLGQEFAGYATQVRLGRDRVTDALPRAEQIPLGGTATGTGLNTHPDFAAGVREKLGIGAPPADPFEAQGNRDALVELSGALKVVAVSFTKIANDLVLMGSGPRTGLAELALPELQKGSSIMPGKVNPVIPRGGAPGRRAR